MIRTQISVDASLYRRAQQLARRHGISLAELVRRSLAETIAREPGEQAWMAYAGRFEGRAGDSESVDEVVYDRETP